MLKEVLIIGLILVAGCTTGYTVYQEEKNESNVTVTNETPQIQEKEIKNTTSKAVDPEKRLVAKGFGIFNYSVLTATNCDDFELAMIDKTTQLRKDIKSKVKNTGDEKDDVTAAEHVYRDSLPRKDEREIERNLERLKEQEDEARAAQDDLDDAEKLLKKYDIILVEIQRECLVLKAKES